MLPLYPRPCSRSTRPIKFSTVFGTVSPYKPMTIRPTDLSPCSTSKNTLCVIFASACERAMAADTQAKIAKTKRTNVTCMVVLGGSFAKQTRNARHVVAPLPRGGQLGRCGTLLTRTTQCICVHNFWCAGKGDSHPRPLNQRIAVKRPISLQRNCPRYSRKALRDI